MKPRGPSFSRSGGRPRRFSFATSSRFLAIILSRILAMAQGIAASYPNPAELNGRMVIAVANFAPRKMAKFGVSEGMILSAATAEGKLKLLDVDAGAQPGDKVG